MIHYDDFFVKSNLIGLYNANNINAAVTMGKHFKVENNDIKLSNVTGTASEVEFLAKATSVKVYTDNWRIVSLDTPVYNDFAN